MKPYRKHKKNKKTKKMCKKQKKCVKNKSYKKYYGGTLFDITGISSLLAMLNELLHAKCPELEIRVGMMSDMTGELSVYSRKSSIIKSVLICLYYRDNCISSVQLLKNGDNIEIRFFTHPDFQRKRYNLLLTYTAFILTGLININSEPIKKIDAYVINPNIAENFMKKFNLYPFMDENENPDFIYFISKKYSEGIPHENIPETVSEFYKTYPTIPITFVIELNEELKERSLLNFRLIVGNIEPENIQQQITCP